MKINNRYFKGLCFVALSLAVSLASCENREKKMDAIERTFKVEYFKQQYGIAKIDRQNELIYLIEPDGVQIPVPLDDVKPVE